MFFNTAVLRLSFSIIFLNLAATSAGWGRKEHDIKSPRITNWGKWGNWQHCPENTFVNAVAIKVQPNLGSGEDNTGMNGVKLFCTPLNTTRNSLLQGPDSASNLTLQTNVITSVVGSLGEWKEWDTCYNGIGTGFSLRSQYYQGEGQFGKEDDTAANEMRLKCIDALGHSSYAGGGGIRGHGWGPFTEEQNCTKGYAVCGIKTQLHEGGDPMDQTAINNVDLLCCPLPSPAELLCNASDSWVIIQEREWTESSTPIEIEIERKTGVSVSKGWENVVSSNDEINYGFTAGLDLSIKLPVRFEASLGISKQTGVSWREMEQSAWNLEDTKKEKYSIQPGCKMQLFQVVGTCGQFNVYTDKIKKVDICKEKSKDKMAGITVCGWMLATVLLLVFGVLGFFYLKMKGKGLYRTQGPKGFYRTQGRNRDGDVHETGKLNGEGRIV